MFKKILFIFGVVAISLTLVGCDRDPDIEFIVETCRVTGDLDGPEPSFDDDLFFEVMYALESNHYTEPSRELLIEGAIEGMIDILDDPFTTYFDSSEAASYIASYGETYVGIGVIVQFLDELVVVQSVMDGGPANTSGIRANDIIVEVDGTNVVGMAFYEIIGYIIGDEGTVVNVGVVRNGIEGILTFSMARAVIDNPTVEYTSYTRDGELIGYIKVNTFGDLTASLFHDAIIDLESDGIDSMIIDLRVNGGGYLTAVLNMLSELLVNNGIEMFATESYMNGLITRNEYFGRLSVAKSYDIVTLVNGNSASASEVFASAMQEHGGYAVIGVNTYGKGTMQTDMDMTASVGDSLHITIGKWFTSEGNWVHYDGGTDGVIPDVIQELNVYERAYKVFLLNDDVILYDTVDDRVANIQLVLNLMGYTVRTDGYFDLASKEAVMEIQTDNSLPVNGNIDSDTLEIINAYLSDYQDDSLNDTQLEAAIDYLTGN